MRMKNCQKALKLYKLQITKNLTWYSEGLWWLRTGTWRWVRRRLRRWFCQVCSYLIQRVPLLFWIPVKLRFRVHSFEQLLIFQFPKFGRSFPILQIFDNQSSNFKSAIFWLFYLSKGNTLGRQNWILQIIMCAFPKNTKHWYVVKMENFEMKNRFFFKFRKLERYLPKIGIFEKALVFFIALKRTFKVCACSCFSVSQ